MYCNSGLHIDSDSESVSQDPAERVENFSEKITHHERYQMDGIWSYWLAHDSNVSYFFAQFTRSVWKQFERWTKLRRSPLID